MRSQKEKHPRRAGCNVQPTGGKSSQRPPHRKRADRPKVSIRQALIVLRNMERGAGTIDALGRATGVSRATVYRILADCKRELGVRFNCEKGAYAVEDWGLLSRRRVLR
jgi:DNA invertase Pin-like site-specific DNA recombinase